MEIPNAEGPEQLSECRSYQKCLGFLYMKEVREKSIPWSPLAARSFHDRQPSCWHAVLKAAPSSCPLPPPLPHIVLLEAAASGNSGRSCRGFYSSSCCQMCSFFAPFPELGFRSPCFALPPALSLPFAYWFCPSQCSLESCGAVGTCRFLEKKPL